MGNDVIRAGTREKGLGKGERRAWLETDVQAYPPHQATVYSPQRQASHSQTVSFLRKTIQTVSGNHICKALTSK
jgi:hypothetical protein